MKEENASLIKANDKEKLHFWNNVPSIIIPDKFEV